jgi:amino acid adenylation domain-containing protein
MSTQSPSSEGIAIIGMAGRFPGARNLGEFWDNLCAGRESIRFFTPEELAAAGVRTDGDSRYVPARGVVEGAELFDAAFFGLTAREAELTDPQQRIFLECAWEALENAGCDARRFAGLIGVFAGAGRNSYERHHLFSHAAYRRLADTHLLAVGNARDFLPARVAYKLGLRGPCLNVQCACATSLASVCVACQSLLHFQCDVALAGGVAVTFPQLRGHRHEEGGILSPDGHCRPFDAQAAGTVHSDGAGVVVLKRLGEALADGDFIYAVIKGFALNNDGAEKMGFAAPTVAGQTAAATLALELAEFDPGTVGYVEAHGTATPLGDPIEFTALSRAFAGAPPGSCALGSVKSNIGHCDAAAGIAGLIKTALMLHHRQLPPTLHFTAPNPQIDFTQGPFQVNTQLRPWPDGPTPRRACVNVLGIGGTNVHVALEEAPVPGPVQPGVTPQLLVLSTRTGTALEQAAANLRAHLERHPDLDLADVAHTLQSGRRSFSHRRIIVCDTLRDAAGLLQHGQPPCVLSREATNELRPVAFLFPGQGAQCVGMTRGLYDGDPTFRADVDYCAGLLIPSLKRDLRGLLFPGLDAREEAGRELARTLLAQPALFVIEHALARLWMRRGIQPVALLGHSVGEWVAATLAGVFTLEDALALVAERARLMESAAPGTMLAVRWSEAELRPFLDESVALAAVNSANQCVVSGPVKAIEALQHRLTAEGIACRPLAAQRAFHSPAMDTAAGAFARIVAGRERHAPKLSCLSNVTGGWLSAAEATDPAYWGEQMRQTVRFSDGVAALVRGRDPILLEVGPGQTLASLVRRDPPDGASVTAVASLPSTAPEADARSLALALGQLWLAGAEPDWEALHAPAKRRRVPLPTYPFERQRCFVDPAPDNDAHEVTNPGTGAAVESRVDDAGTARLMNSPFETAETPACGDGCVASGVRRLLGRLSGTELKEEDLSVPFVGLGFDSLFLTGISAAVEREFGVRVTFKQLLGELDTPRALAEFIHTGRGGSDRQTRVNETIPADSPPVPLPLTEAQAEIWLASQAGTGASSAYNESRVLDLRGPLQTGALQRAVQQLVNRHEALRATFAADGSTQRIRDHLSIELPVTDLSAHGVEERAWELEAIERQEAGEPFDLVSGPLVRARLVRLEPERHVAFLTVHHLVCDGQAWGILLGELAGLYSAAITGGPVKPPAGASYSDGVLARAQQQAGDESLAHWRQRFADPVPALELPADRPRPSHWCYEGAREESRVPATVGERVKALGARHGCTLFQTLLAAFWTLLHRLAGQEDLVIGVPVADRPGEQDAGTVGHFIDFLPVRLRACGESSVANLLTTVRQGFLEDYAHRACGFGTLLGLLDVDRSPDRMPLAPVTFNVDRLDVPLRLAGLETEARLNRHSRTQFDLSFNVTEESGGLRLACRYSTALFEAATIRRWLGHYQTILEGFADASERRVCDVPLLTGDERRVLLEEWNATAAPFPADRCVHELFEEQVARAPAAVAVMFGTAAMTYRELDERANELASHLNALGVEAGVSVGVCLERSLELLVAVLGVLKAGGACLPLDPAYPRERLARMLALGLPHLVLATRDTVGVLPEESPQMILLGERKGRARPPRACPVPAVPPSPAHPVYILFTSGSTGVPKGVVMPHRALVNLLCWQREHSCAGPGTRTVQFAALSFDVSFQEMFSTWHTGGTLVLIQEELRHDPAALLRFLHAQRIERLFLPPVMLDQLAEAVPARTPLPKGLREVITAGEALRITPSVRAFFAKLPPCVLHNQYGPAESHVVTSFTLRDSPAEWPARPPIGRPVANVRVHILDEHLQPVPAGVAGEIFIGGLCLADGYLNQPELTGERFLLDPFAPGPDARLYRTGDRARYRADGDIEFLGRCDEQVKVRGCRVEPGEVETALAQEAGVQSCTVVAREDAAGQAQLVGCVVPLPDCAMPTPAELRRSLRAKLPEYMVPSSFVFLDQLPLTPNGKVDRQVLALMTPEPDGTDDVTGIAPRTPVEATLAAIWREVLGVNRVGVEDDFFDLGGHSLRLTQVLVRVREAFDVEVPVRAYYEARTIATQAAVIEEHLAHGTGQASGERTQCLAMAGAPEEKDAA